MSAKFNFFNYLLHDFMEIDPSDRVLDLVNAVASTFISFKEELEPPSSAVVALSANAGNNLTSSLSCALNCVTDNHLLLEKICDFLIKNDTTNSSLVYNQFCALKIMIPGMGHPSIKEEDPRVIYLLDEFKDIAGEKVNFYLELQKLVPVHINIGGAMCALLLDAGLPSDHILYFPLIGRLFGWCEIYRKTKSQYPKVLPSNKLLSLTQ